MRRHVAVIGAGAFGGWTALSLVRAGARVTLVDAWGPGNARASSGGETRVIRAGYGSRTLYSVMAARALALWREHDRRFQRQFFRQTGALWLFGRDATFGHAAAEGLAASGLPLEWLSPAQAARRYPQISFDDVETILFEPEAGYLLARRACEHVAECVSSEGGTVVTAAVAGPAPLGASIPGPLALSDGSRLEADAYVFACGPWLGTLLPDVVGDLVTPTRQEVYYFGTPAGDTRFSDAQMPVWLDFGGRLIYGIPGNANRGFKLADDTPGPAFDPTHGSREMSGQGLSDARAFLRRRFPALADAPMLGGEVCQYEASPDGHFIVDRHPDMANVWIAGGGSGHGFKMGPVVGEVIARAVLAGGPVPAEWRLTRFSAGERDAGGKWS